MKRSLFATSAVLALVFGLVAGPRSGAKPSDLPSNNQIECPDGSDDPVQLPRFAIEVNVDLLSKSVAVAVQPEAPGQIDAVSAAVVSAYLQQLLAHINEAVAVANRQRLAAAAAEKAQKERTLETRLFDPVKVRIEQVPFQQAIKNLAQVSGLPIVIDYKALRDARINLDTPVTLKMENRSVHKALCQFLDEVNLAYVIDAAGVKITTKDNRPHEAEKFARANEQLAQRIFDAGEIFRRAGDYERAHACYQRVHRLTPTSLHGRVAITRLIEIEERMRDAAEEQGGPGRTDDPEPEQAFRPMRERTVPLGLVHVSY